MPDRVDPSKKAFRRGPWPVVTDLSRIYDDGQPWWVNLAGHSDHDGDYPDARRLVPWPECHSREVSRPRRPRSGRYERDRHTARGA